MAAKTLVTMFRRADEAESAAYRLREDGFPLEAVGWVTRAENGREIVHGNLVQRPKQSASGRTRIGGLLGALLGLLVAVAALGVAGVLRSVLVVASLVLVFVGVAIVAATGRGGDASMRREAPVPVPREQARRYAGQLRRGEAVVTVTVNDEQQEARALGILRGEADLHRHPLVWRIPALSDEGRPSRPSLPV